MLHGYAMKRSELVRRLNELGWTSTRGGKGSHEIFAHPKGTRPIPVPKHSGEIPEPLARTILSQAIKNVNRDDRH